MKKLILIGDSIRLGYQPHVVASLAGDAEASRAIRKLRIKQKDARNLKGMDFG